MKYFLSHREGGGGKFAGNRIERARDRVGSRLAVSTHLDAIGFGNVIINRVRRID